MLCVLVLHEVLQLFQCAGAIHGGHDSTAACTSAWFNRSAGLSCWQIHYALFSLCHRHLRPQTKLAEQRWSPPGIVALALGNWLIKNAWCHACESLQQANCHSAVQVASGADNSHRQSWRTDHSDLNGYTGTFYRFRPKLCNLASM